MTESPPSRTAVQLLWLPLSAFLVFLAAAPVVHPYYPSPAVVTLVTIPIGLAGWKAGVVGAVIGWLAGLVASVSILAALGYAAGGLANLGGIFGFSVVLALALALGRMRDLQDSVRQGVRRHRLAERALGESRDLFSTLFENAPFGMAIADGDGRISQANPALQDLLGRARDEIEGELFALFTHPEDIDSDRRSLQDMIAGTRPGYRVEKRYLKPDGQVIPAELVVFAVRDRGGDFRYGFSVVLDLRDRKKAEREMLHLERLKALGEMTAGVSHNLNNILMGILPPASRLKDSAGVAPDLQDIDDIHLSATRARDLARRLQRALQTKEEERRPVLLADAIEDALVASRPRWKDEAESGGISIRVVREIEDVPRVAATAEIHDVLLNLIFNAVDALPTGGTITIRVRAVGQKVLLSVIDDGVGMSEDTGARAFEPFFTTKTDVGSGLGLSTVRGTVASWGGRVWIESESNAGTRLHLELNPWVGAEPAVAADLRASPAERHRVAVVDDDELVRRVVARMLEAHHQVHQFSNAISILTDFRRDSFDILLIDLSMPEKPGDELARALRARDPHVALILLTGWKLQPGDPRGEPFDFLLEKPVGMAELREVTGRAAELCTQRRYSGNQV